jgi:hypothetical protein
LSRQLIYQSIAYCSIVIVKPDAKVMTIEPASDAFMIKAVFLGERLML